MNDESKNATSDRELQQQVVIETPEQMAAKLPVLANPTQFPDVTADSLDGSGETILVDVSKYGSKELEQALQDALGLDMLDTNEVMLFGSSPQTELSDFLDTLLEGITAGELGEAGDAAIQLAKGIEVSKVREFQNQMKNGKHWWQYFLFWIDYARVFRNRHRDFLAIVEEILHDAIERKDGLAKENIKLDNLVEKNEEIQKMMGLCIISAEMAHVLAKEHLRQLTEKADQTKDPMDQNAVRDFQNQLTAFEVRIADMKGSFLRAMMAVPQIRTVQESTRIEMQNVVRIVTTDLPALKQAVVMVGANQKVLAAQSERQKMTQTRRDLEKMAMDMTGQASVAAKQSQGQEVLNEANHIADLCTGILDILNKNVEMDKENKQLRQQASQQLAAAKINLQKGLEKVKELQNDGVATAEVGEGTD